MVEFLLCQLKEQGIDTPPSLLDGFELPPAYDVPLAPRRRYTPASRPNTSSSRSSSDAGLPAMGSRSHSPYRSGPSSPLVTQSGGQSSTTKMTPSLSSPTFRTITSDDGFSYSLVHFPRQESNHTLRYNEVSKKEMNH